MKFKASPHCIIYGDVAHCKIRLLSPASLHVLFTNQVCIHNNSSLAARRQKRYGIRTDQPTNQPTDKPTDGWTHPHKESWPTTKNMLEFFSGRMIVKQVFISPLEPIKESPANSKFIHNVSHSLKKTTGKKSTLHVRIVARIL